MSMAESRANIPKEILIHGHIKYEPKVYEIVIFVRNIFIGTHETSPTCQTSVSDREISKHFFGVKRQAGANVIKIYGYDLFMFVIS
jgi:hypothetical protein